MRFKKIELSDLQDIRRIVEKTAYQSCQLSVGSLYSFAEKYDTEICIEDEYLYVKQSRTGMPVCYFMPVGVGGLKTAISKLKNYQGGEINLWGIADDMKEEFLDVVPDAELVPDRDWAEYIHTSQNLINMQGKKFHAKKNAVNQFLRNYWDFEYEAISRDNIDEVLDFQHNLLAEKKKLEKDEETINALILENHCIERAIASYDELGMIGGLIRIDYEICAFAFGSPINSNTFDMLFEKAQKNYNGIFQVLEQQMIVNDLTDFGFINREEDLGIQGLRFAKQNLCPDILLMKHTTTA